MLADHLHREGLTELDLSPGEEYKERFASRTDDAFTVVVRFSHAAATAAHLRRGVRHFARGLASASGIDPGAARARLGTMVARARSVPLRALPALTVQHVARLVRDQVELRVYAFDLRQSPAAPDTHFRRDAIPDLLCYTQADRRLPERFAFLGAALARLEDGHHAYTLVLNGVLAHCGWMIDRQETATLSEVGQQFDLPPGSAMLYDFFTHPLFRGRGLYRAALSRMLADAARLPDATHACITVQADNGPSRHVIESLGFRLVSRLHRRRLLGRVRAWRDDATGGIELPRATPLTAVPPDGTEG
jgi:GNAT superfamily N-acetyltransferase